MRKSEAKWLVSLIFILLSTSGSPAWGCETTPLFFGRAGCVAESWSVAEKVDLSACRAALTQGSVGGGTRFEKECVRLALFARDHELAAAYKQRIVSARSATKKKSPSTNMITNDRAHPRRAKQGPFLEGDGWVAYKMAVADEPCPVSYLSMVWDKGFREELRPDQRFNEVFRSHIQPALSSRCRGKYDFVQLHMYFKDYVISNNSEIMKEEDYLKIMSSREYNDDVPLWGIHIKIGDPNPQRYAVGAFSGEIEGGYLSGEFWSLASLRSRVMEIIQEQNEANNCGGPVVSVSGREHFRDGRLVRIFDCRLTDLSRYQNSTSFWAKLTDMLDGTVTQSSNPIVSAGHYADYVASFTIASSRECGGEIWGGAVKSSLDRTVTRDGVLLNSATDEIFVPTVFLDDVYRAVEASDDYFSGRVIGSVSTADMQSLFRRYGCQGAEAQRLIVALQHFKAQFHRIPVATE